MYKLKKENISGISPIIIENAEKDNMLLNVEGDNYQAETPTLENPSEVEAVGDNINFFNKETATEDYYVNSSGELINYTTNKFYASDYMEVLPEEDYTYSGNSTIQTGFSAKGAFYDSNKSFLNYFNINNVATTITTPENCKYIRMSVSGNDIDTFKLEKGTAATPYSQYGQGNIEIIHNNKNFLNFPDRNVTQNGVTIQITNGNHFKITGTQTGIVNYELFSSDYFENINNIAYNKYPVTISRNTTGYLDIELNFASGTNNWYMQIARNTTKVIKNILNEKINRLSLYISFSSTKEINYEFDLQLEISEEPTEIITPYNKAYNLPIQKPFYKIGDYVDNFIKQDKKWYEQHYIKELILTGEEEWSQSLLNSFPTFLLTIRTNMIKGKDGLCNYFKIYNSVWQLDLEGIEFYDIHLNDFKFRINLGSNSKITTLEAWKAKVQELYNAGTPIKVYYVLATPKLIECTEEQSNILDKFETFDGQNTITINTFNNTNPNILINYTPKMTDEIKQAFTKNITKAYVIRTRDGFEINQDNYLKDYKLEELRFVPDNGFIGGTVARRLTLDFNNVDNQFDIQDEDLRFFAGVEYEGKDYYIDYGDFIVQKPETENTTDNTNATCLDYMCLLNATYNDEMTYPCTLGELAENVCSQAGLELATKTFRNSDFIVTDNQFVNNEPLRTILGAIALSAFSWARIGQDNRVYIDFTIKQQEDISLDYDSYFNLSMASKPFGPINRIILRNSQVEGENITVQDDESIAENGVHELVITDNPFAYTQEKREQLIEAGKEFYGFTYMPITSMDTIGYAFLDSNSLIKINDMQDKANYAYVFNHTIDYNGALLDSIESPALTETETKYTYTPEEVQKQRRTEIIVDKHEQTITAIIQEQDELNNRQNVFEQNLDSTTNTISEVNEDLTERINQLQVNLDGLSQTVSQKGGDNIFSYAKEFWTGETDEDIANLEEYTDTEIQQNSVSGVGYIINQGTSKQNVQVKNDTYTISFTYKKLIELATGYVLINGNRYDLDSMDWDEFVLTLDINTNYIDFEVISDTDNTFQIFDLMGSVGNEKQIWTQNANETRTDTVKIGKGITVSSSLTNTIWKADADGNRIINTDTGETVAEFTDKGTVTKNIEVQETAEIAGILIQEIDNQTWISSLL